MEIFNILADVYYLAPALVFILVPLLVLGYMVNGWAVAHAEMQDKAQND